MIRRLAGFVFVLGLGWSFALAQAPGPDMPVKPKVRQLNPEAPPDEKDPAKKTAPPAKDDDEDPPAKTIPPKEVLPKGPSAKPDSKLAVEKPTVAVATDKLLDNLVTRNVGPAAMGGRIVSIAGVEKDDVKTVYVACATGGVWRSDNSGVTWKQTFDSTGNHSMGCIAVSKSNPDVVWAGSGEVNPRNSVSWGLGVYKSTDGAKTWTHVGLADTQHVSQICIHPTNSDVVYVAALGRLWAPSKERGIYKTEDGGKTWNLIKFIDENTGFIDLVMDPSDPDTLYGGAWAVRRSDVKPAWSPLSDVGPNGGIFKTTDGGKSWKKLVKGLPNRPTGRIGLDVHRKNPNILYAIVATDQTTKGRQAASQGVVGPVDKGGIFRSDDKGETWTKVNDLLERQFYFTVIRVDPENPQRVYYLGLQTKISKDGGKTFGPGGGGHADMHAMWIDPRDPNRIFLGNDGGAYLSTDRGEKWARLNNMPIGQFYHCDVDMSSPYRIYGGLQDNSCWGGPSASRYTNGLVNADWKVLGGGDGFHCLADPSNPKIVYTESQFGAIVRHTAGVGAKSIKPRVEGARFNWNTPLALSPHDPATLYVGSNVLFKSTNRGDAPKAISPNLTNGRPGAVSGMDANCHTLTTISESPVKAGVIYVGADDGRIHVTKDAGASWTDLTKNIPDLPLARWISRVECSRFAEGTAYVSIDRHRNDDVKPYLYVTTDFGATWKSIASNLPEHGPVHVIRADPRNPNLLYAGTEYALFVSLDAGLSWSRLPTVAPAPMHHAVVHPRDRDLVIATHGRGIWIVDVAPLQQMTPDVLAKDAYLFDVKPAVLWNRIPRETNDDKQFVVPNPPIGAFVYYHLKNPAAEPVSIEVLDSEKKVVSRMKGPTQAGLQRVLWNCKSPKDDDAKMDEEPMEDMPKRPAPRVKPGDYLVRLQIGGRTLEKPVRVLADDGKSVDIPMPDRLAKVSRQQARLGVRLEKGKDGLQIVEVLPGGAADRAGMQDKDVLVEIDGRPVPADLAGLDQILERIAPDVPVPAVVLRRGQQVPIEEVTLPEKGGYQDEFNQD